MAGMADEDILSLILNDKTKDEGFRHLLEAHQQRLYWVIRRLVGVHEDTDDVLQNTFIKVYRNIANFQSNSTLYTWLHRIAVNEAISFLRKSKRQVQTEALSYEDTLGISNVDDPQADEIERKLSLAIETLPNKQKQVFNLRYYDEMTYEEIAQTLSTSVGSLKASYHHAVKKIENYLQDK